MNEFTDAAGALTRLGHLGVLSVTGPDVRGFLQGQLSCDMRELGPERALLASVNSPQGRVQAVLTLLALEDGCLAILPAELLGRVVERLRKYVLRARVSVDDAGAAHVCYGADAPALARALPGLPIPVTPGAATSGAGLRVARLTAGGPLLVIGRPGGPARPDGDAPWRLAAIRAGRPQIYLPTWESFVAQMLNLDLLGGVSFEKGCYTGQEIIARTYFRGAVKRRMLRFATDAAAPDPGTRVVSGEEHAGDVVDAAMTGTGAEILAVVSAARQDAALALATGGALTRLPLPYSIEQTGAP
jgi:tRNA-modifying protein YgfZ